MSAISPDVIELISSINVDVSASVGFAWRRCARVVVAIVALKDDPRTLDECSRGIGVSRGAIKTWCRVAGVKPKNLMDFSRLLRAAIRDGRCDWNPHESLNIVDPRTLRRLLQRAGIEGKTASRFEPVQFLRAQRLVLEPKLIELLIEKFGPRSVSA